jgi:hypothetical protein
MSDNPVDGAFDAVEDEQAEEESGDDFDLDEYYDVLGTGTKEKTVGIAVTEETHAFYSELRDAEEVDVDPAESIRGHLEKLANRHPEVFERAMRKLEIDREY